MAGLVARGLCGTAASLHRPRARRVAMPDELAGRIELRPHASYLSRIGNRVSFAPTLLVPIYAKVEVVEEANRFPLVREASSLARTGRHAPHPFVLNRPVSTGEVLENWHTLAAKSPTSSNPFRPGPAPAKHARPGRAPLPSRCGKSLLESALVRIGVRSWAELTPLRQRRRQEADGE